MTMFTIGLTMFILAITYFTWQTWQTAKYTKYMKKQALYRAAELAGRMRLDSDNNCEEV